MINEEVKNLINSYIDNELSERKVVEVSRLLDHDKKAAEYYHSIMKVRQLLGGLQYSEIPEDFSDSIIAELERKTIMDNFDAGTSTSSGAKHLYARKFAAAAAILVLVGGLSMMIFEILSPIDAPVKNGVVQTVSADKDGDVENIQPIKIKLNLYTVDLAESTKMFNGLIYSQMMIDNTVPYRQNEFSKYVINCSKEQAISLIAAMESDWKQFQFADAVISISDSQNSQDIAAIEPDQLITLLAVSDPQARMAKAARFARSNKEELSRSLKKVDIIDEPVEPKLTSDKLDSSDKFSTAEYPVSIEMIIMSVKSED